MKTLVFDDVVTGDTVVFTARRLLVAGFTGRDAAAVDAHIRELAEIGVPVPDAVPALYQPTVDLLQQTPVIAVGGPNTSGEVEPVVFRHEGRDYLTVGSDHTDRDVETVDIERSKGAATKPIGTTCVAVEHIEDWDELELRARQDDVDYQKGTTGELRTLSSLLEHLIGTGAELEDGDVLFLGTVPTIGPVRPGRRFDASISAHTWTLELGYDIVDTSHRVGAPMTKPEMELTDVEQFAFVQVPGGADGLTERILAADPSTGIATRMLRFAPGTDTSEAGVLRHDFWEEVYILTGELHDLTLDQVFPAGTYACRPPGMPHGPWRSDPGCVTFEVRYPVT